MNQQPLSPDLNARFEQQLESAEWVDSDARLAELCQRWRRLDMVGLDTEFIRTDTFYPQPGLIQLGCSEGVYFIDPLAIEDMRPFAALLEDPQVLKVLHACSEDLELFYTAFGALPRPLFDTQIACAFLDLGLSVGYQRLLETLFGLYVDKQETRSDWLQRPLTDAQLHYAALDVVYLEEVYRRQIEQLQPLGYVGWVLQEGERLVAALEDVEDPERYYLRFNQTWKMTPEQLAVLKNLAAWRERESRLRDMPRSFLLHNTSLLAIASRPPLHRGQLARVERLRGRTLKMDGEQILTLVRDAQEEAKTTPPERPDPPLSTSAGKKLKALRAVVASIAADKGIAPELLARKKDLEALLRSGWPSGPYQLPESLQGWRQGLIGDALLTCLNH